MRQAPKTMALTTALALALPFALAACSSDSGNATASTNPDAVMPAADDPLADQSGVLTPANPTTFTTWITSAEAVPASDNKLTKLLQEKLGVTIEYELVTPDNVDQKIGVMLAGGEYPDLIGTTDLKLRLLEGGALLRLDDMLESGDYPNLETHTEGYLKRMSYYGGEVDDGLYIFPNYNRFYGEITGGVHYGTAFWIQKRVLEDAGWPDLDNMTLDKYFELIENYLAKNPTTEGVPTQGFEILASVGREWGMTNPPMFLSGNPNNGGVIVDDNDVATVYANTDIAKDWYQKLNEEYNKGVVDPESFTMTFDQYVAKIATGAVLGMHDQGWNFQNATNSLQGAGMDQYTYVPLMPVYDGAEPYYADRDVMNANQGFGISSTTDKATQAMKFLDIMLSEEWQKVLSWGIEGEDYEVDDDGMFYRTEQQRTNSKDMTWRSSNKLMALRDMLPKHNGQFSDGNAYEPDGQPAEFYATLTDYDKQVMEAYDKQTWREFVNSPPENPVYYPCWSLSFDQEITDIGQQMTDANVQNLPGVIAGTTTDFDKNWQSYLDIYSKIDVAAYEEAVNAGIQDRLKNWQ